MALKEKPFESKEPSDFQSHLEETLAATHIIDFMIVDQGSAYNAPNGRPLLKEMTVITSIYHLSMKFPTPAGVGFVKGCQYESRECYNRAVKNLRSPGTPRKLC